MTIFRNLKNQSTFYNHHASRSTLSKEEIKTKFLYLMTIDEVVEFDVLNKEAEKIEDLEKR